MFSPRSGAGIEAWDGAILSRKTIDPARDVFFVCRSSDGVPVATVGVGGAVNAALLAVQILAVSDQSLTEKLAAYKRAAAEKVRKKDLAIQEKYNLIKV